MSRAQPRFRRVNPPLPVTSTAILRLTVFVLVDGQQCLMNFDYQIVSGPIAGTAEADLIVAWRLANEPALQAIISNDALITGYKCAMISQPTRIPAYFVIALGGLLGTGGATHLPTTVAGVVSKYTLIKGQHGRGRNYVPAVPTAFVTPGTNADSMNAAGLAAYATFAGLMAAGLLGAGTNFSPCISQRDKGVVAVTKAENVVQTIVRPLLGTVRRRRVGRGK